ncbi:hypothetical protein SporoP37_04965 [Sporosarcina sp. P37]|uniref:DUF3221 domain-containing protein n=1 Tax=unclassified Sporosarcina TaxID=2647733 RepID=UPI000A17DC30|nr:MULTISPECIES: DUF3221 domain-containing protein [unclassified Sporosarcina]ARK24095.1 hypothetical protein SporoP37_04965 [Sporosarcina sp. P37]PID18512.1 DUF3221 domain-containing protein [Sporosarcina sp. P35]
MKKTIWLFVLGAALLAGGCGTGTKEPSVSSQQGGWQTIKTVDGREIIAELKQTAEESPARDRIAREQIESPDYTGGFFGEPSKELEEDVAMQAIEGPIAIEVVEEVYGSHDAFEKEGVLFLENQTYGDAQSGVWIGVKKPDERLQKVVDLLQKKVDAGEILAAPIYIFRSVYTREDLHAVQDEVAAVLQDLKQKRGTFSLSVSTVTGDVEVGHDFLTAAQQKELEQQFPDYTFHFEQLGSAVEEAGLSAIIRPQKDTTDTPAEVGGYIMAVSDGGIFVSGGTEEAAYYSFDEANDLTVGQRVKVEVSGEMKESYPAQGSAKFVEVLPDYKPADAVLSESQAVALAIKQKKQEYFSFNVINEVRYDKAQKVWIVKVSDGSEVLVEDN